MNSLLSDVSKVQNQMAQWRHEIHKHPETAFEEVKTAAYVASLLESWGYAVVTGIGKTGIVASLKAGEGEKIIGLRADMDALPVTEAVESEYKSRNAGKMHACGHDGHTAMLLGAAKYLAEKKNFSGTVRLIFQPAEETISGASAMIADGLLERFPMDAIFGMHNMPGLPVGRFAIRTGPFFASTDEFRIRITGRGGHAAWPNQAIDPIVIGAQLVQAIQTIASRNADPVSALVVSVTQFHAGTAHNVIPEEAEVSGTVRALSPENRALGEARIKALAENIAAAHGATAEVNWRRGYPVMVNHSAEADICAQFAAEVAGANAVDAEAEPLMGGEDFAYMTQARPGALILIGNGETAGLHHPAYDFNDEIIPLGISYWTALAEGNGKAA